MGTWNQRRFVNQLEKLLRKPHAYYAKRLTYPYTFVTDIFKDLPWTKSDEVKVSFTKWLLDVVMDEMVNTFYITENNKNVILYFHKYDWAMITKRHMENLVQNEKLVRVEEDEDIESTPIRFLPSGNKLRILNFISNRFKNDEKKLLHNFKRKNSRSPRQHPYTSILFIIEAFQ